jgi:hypothetical protein
MRCDSLIEANTSDAQLSGAGAAGAGVRVGDGVRGGNDAVGVAAAGEAEGDAAAELGDGGVSIAVGGAELGAGDAAQPAMSEASNATVTRRAAGCGRRDVMQPRLVVRPVGAGEP